MHRPDMLQLKPKITNTFCGELSLKLSSTRYLALDFSDICCERFLLTQSHFPFFRSFGIVLSKRAKCFKSRSMQFCVLKESVVSQLNSRFAPAICLFSVVWIAVKNHQKSIKLFGSWILRYVLPQLKEIFPRKLEWKPERLRK